MLYLPLLLSGRKYLLGYLTKKIATEGIMALKAITEIALATNRDPTTNCIALIFLDF